MLEIQQYLDQKYPSNQGFFVFGSWAYGTNLPGSDIDLVVIEDSMDGQTVSGKYDIQFLSLERFLNQIKECDIKAMEGLFGPYSAFKVKIDQKIDWSFLRASIAQKSSHSFVKAKKKIEVDKNIKTGQKSLFHSLRIMEFGKQLAQDKRITNFSVANHLYQDILSKDSWEELHKDYKPLYNQLHSEFKKLCPK